MCGICGIASSHGRADLDRVAAMSATLVHRGPDSFGEYVDGPVALAARRLSIIDLETGDQPIANEDGTIHVVQNGELYNYRELRRELERAGHRFRTNGDTEVLLHLYEEHGGDVRLERFARPAPAVEERDEEQAELVEELRARLRDSVRAHLVSDVTVGVLLSGGVDSSLLAALAAEESSEPLRTFSIGFEERSFDELADARLVAERYGTKHRELVLRPDAALLLPALAEAFDEPFADSSALPTYLVSQLAAEDVKVALSGEGGDELFGGYYTYDEDLLAERVGGLARLVRPLVERLPTSSRKASFDYKAKRFVRAAHLPPLERHHGWKEIFSPDARAALTERRSDFDPVDL